MVIDSVDAIKADNQNNEEGLGVSYKMEPDCFSTEEIRNPGRLDRLAHEIQDPLQLSKARECLATEDSRKIHTIQSSAAMKRRPKLLQNKILERIFGFEGMLIKGEKDKIIKSKCAKLEQTRTSWKNMLKQVKKLKTANKKIEAEIEKMEGQVEGMMPKLLFLEENIEILSLIKQ